MAFCECNITFIGENFILHEALYVQVMHTTDKWCCHLAHLKSLFMAAYFVCRHHKKSENVLFLIYFFGMIQRPQPKVRHFDIFPWCTTFYIK